MSRRNISNKISKKYSTKISFLFNKFINIIMKHGKKSKAEKIVTSAFKEIKNNLNIDNNLIFFSRVLDNIKPIVEVKSRRIGGTTYHIPVVVREDRQNTLAMRWLVQGARKRDKEKSMYKRLANELIDAFRDKGYAHQRREEVHRLAESNKAFAHYRW